jgi:hypothetical protein
MVLTKITMDDKYKKIDEKSKIITDRLGCKIDDGIRELIVLLNYNNIGTTQSCWGHKNWGEKFPWFDIDGKYYDDIKSIIFDLEIGFEKYDVNTIRFYPKCKTLIKGRREFNKLKDKLKQTNN